LRTSRINKEHSSGEVSAQGRMHAWSGRRGKKRNIHDLIINRKYYIIVVLYGR
jgi:hypothetical protein